MLAGRAVDEIAELPVPCKGWLVELISMSRQLPSKTLTWRIGRSHCVNNITRCLGYAIESNYAILA